jgi:hypothetical protein
VVAGVVRRGSRGEAVRGGRRSAGRRGDAEEGIVVCRRPGQGLEDGRGLAVTSGGKGRGAIHTAEGRADVSQFRGDGVVHASLAGAPRRADRRFAVWRDGQRRTSVRGLVVEAGKAGTQSLGRRACAPWLREGRRRKGEDRSGAALMAIEEAGHKRWHLGDRPIVVNELSGSRRCWSRREARERSPGGRGGGRTRAV